MRREAAEADEIAWQTTKGQDRVASAQAMARITVRT
jgi:hypothetical protein